MDAIGNPLLVFFSSKLVLAIQEYNTRLLAIKTTIQSLPSTNYTILSYLMSHLDRVIAHSATNKMEGTNLAIVFGPTLIREPDGRGGNAFQDILAMSRYNQLVDNILGQGKL